MRVLSGSGLDAFHGYGRGFTRQGLLPDSLLVVFPSPDGGALVPGHRPGMIAGEAGTASNTAASSFPNGPEDTRR